MEDKLPVPMLMVMVMVMVVVGEAQAPLGQTDPLTGLGGPPTRLGASSMSIEGACRRKTNAAPMVMVGEAQAPLLQIH